MLGVALLSVSFAACSSDDDASAPTNKPTVSVVAATAGQTTLSFTITPENAEKCSYVCLEPGEAIPSAEEILANEINLVSATEPTFVEVTGLATETEYTIVAAVTDGTTAVVSAPVKMMTLATNALIAHGMSGNIASGFGTAPKEAALRFFVGPDDILEVPVFFDNKAKYLPAGTYIVGTAEEPGVIDKSNSDYCYFYYGGELLQLSSGTMTIDIVDGEYDITFDFSTNGGEFCVKYKGDIDGIQLYFDLSILNQASRVQPEGEVAGQYCIKLLEGSARNQELTLNFYADPESTTLPAGTYQVSSSTNPGNIGPGSVFTNKVPSLTTDVLASGSVEVTVNGDVYTFNMLFTDEEGYTLKGTFTGEIAYMERDNGDTGDATVVNFNRLKTGFKDDESLSYLLLIDDSSGAMLEMDVYTAAPYSVYLPAGTYTVATGTDAWTIQKGTKTYLTLKIDGKNTKVYITEGTMTVSYDGEECTLVLDATTDRGKYCCKYTGSID